MSSEENAERPTKGQSYRHRNRKAIRQLEEAIAVWTDSVRRDPFAALSNSVEIFRAAGELVLRQELEERFGRHGNLLPVDAICLTWFAYLKGEILGNVETPYTEFATTTRALAFQARQMARGKILREMASHGLCSEADREVFK